MVKGITDSRYDVQGCGECLMMNKAGDRPSGYEGPRLYRPELAKHFTSLPWAGLHITGESDKVRKPAHSAELALIIAYTSRAKLHTVPKSLREMGQ